MRLILNILWLVLSGFWLFLGYLAAGIVLCILILTIPWGIASFRIGLYALWPFGREIVAKPTAGVGSFLGNVVWVILAGWSLEPQLGRRRAAGVALAGVGAVFALPTATAAAIGATEALRGWNSQIGVLPWHLARMTGLYDARFPTEVLVVAAVVAALMTITGIVLALPLRAEERRRRVSSS